MEYSAIIRTKNSERTIESCLLSIVKQTIKPARIIIVDSGSEDATLDIIKKFKVILIKYPQNTIFNYSKALNIGIVRSDSPYILIISSHVSLPCAKSLYFMIKQIEESKACEGVSLNRVNKTVNSPLLKEDSSLNIEIINYKNFKGRALFNYCSLIKKSSWESYNFNENIPTCEDQEWALMQLKRNKTFQIIHNLYANYNNPYYNFKKDAWETIVLGTYIYPFFVSNEYSKQLINTAFNEFIRGRFKGAYKNVYIASHILFHKHITKIEISPMYNEKLN